MAGSAMADLGGRMAETLTLATWNVNSIKVRLPQVMEWLGEHQPDIVAFQELKTPTEDFPLEPFQERGYNAIVLGQKTYNGVAILAKDEFDRVQVGLSELPGDEQARLVEARVGDLSVIDVYVPNGQEVGSEKYAYKLLWLEALAKALERRFDPTQKLAILGDFNIAPEDRDCFDPTGFYEQVLCSSRERQALRRLLDWGLVDLFRRLHPDEKQYSWWDYRMNAFRRNRGLRIDLILATGPLAAQAVTCVIDKTPRGWEQPSDHAPVLASFRREP